MQGKKSQNTKRTRKGLEGDRVRFNRSRNAGREETVDHGCLPARRATAQRE
jgi:hypothetical protein